MHATIAVFGRREGGKRRVAAAASSLAGKKKGPSLQHRRKERENVAGWRKTLSASDRTTKQETWFIFRTQTVVPEID